MRHPCRHSLFTPRENQPKEAFQKAIRSLEIGRSGLGFAKDFNQRPLKELLELLRFRTSERQFVLYEALRKGADMEDLYKRTCIKPGFPHQMREPVDLEEEILRCRGANVPDALPAQAKRDGFADKYLDRLLQVPEREIRQRRLEMGIVEVWGRVPVSGV